MKNPAQRAREHKEKHPENFCAHPKCLWRVVNSFTGVMTPCENHPMAGAGKAKEPAGDDHWSRYSAGLSASQ
jgi:hypothetical protein